MQNAWKVLMAIFIVGIIGLGVFTINNPNLKARIDEILNWN